MKVQFKGGNVMKKLFKFLVIVFMFVILLGTIEVNAAKITIVKDENPDRVTVLSLLDDNYYIEVNDENNIGYLYSEIRGYTELLGTVRVDIFDEFNDYSYTLCESNHCSIGSLIISIEDNNLIIYEAYGDISNVFPVGTIVTFE